MKAENGLQPESLNSLMQRIKSLQFSLGISPEEREYAVWSINNREKQARAYLTRLQNVYQILDQQQVFALQRRSAIDFIQNAFVHPPNQTELIINLVQYKLLTFQLIQIYSLLQTTLGCPSNFELKINSQSLYQQINDEQLLNLSQFATLVYYIDLYTGQSQNHVKDLIEREPELKRNEEILTKMVLFDQNNKSIFQFWTRCQKIYQVKMNQEVDVFEIDIVVFDKIRAEEERMTQQITKQIQTDKTYGQKMCKISTLMSVQKLDFYSKVVNKDAQKDKKETNLMTVQEQMDRKSVSLLTQMETFDFSAKSTQKNQLRDEVQVELTKSQNVQQNDENQINTQLLLQDIKKFLTVNEPMQIIQMYQDELGITGPEREYTQQCMEQSAESYDRYFKNLENMSRLIKQYQICAENRNILVGQLYKIVQESKGSLTELLLLFEQFQENIINAILIMQEIQKGTRMPLDENFEITPVYNDLINLFNDQLIELLFKAMGVKRNINSSSLTTMNRAKLLLNVAAKDSFSEIILSFWQRFNELSQQIMKKQIKIHNSSEKCFQCVSDEDKKIQQFTKFMQSCIKNQIIICKIPIDSKQFECFKAPNILWAGFAMQKLEDQITMQKSDQFFVQDDFQPEPVQEKSNDKELDAEIRQLQKQLDICEQEVKKAKETIQKQENYEMNKHIYAQKLHKIISIKQRYNQLMTQRKSILLNINQIVVAQKGSQQQLKNLASQFQANTIQLFDLVSAFQSLVYLSLTPNFTISNVFQQLVLDFSDQFICTLLKILKLPLQSCAVVSNSISSRTKLLFQVPQPEVPNIFSILRQSDEQLISFDQNQFIQLVENEQNNLQKTQKLVIKCKKFKKGVFLVPVSGGIDLYEEGEWRGFVDESVQVGGGRGSQDVKK